MPIRLWLRLKSPLWPHLAIIFLLLTFPEFIRVILAGDVSPKVIGTCWSAFCCLFGAQYTWLERVRGPLAIEILWPFLLTCRNLQSKFSGTVPIFQIHVRCAVCPMYNRSQVLKGCNIIFPSWKIYWKEILHPFPSHLQALQLAISTLHRPSP